MLKSASKEVAAQIPRTAFRDSTMPIQLAMSSGGLEIQKIMFYPGTAFMSI